MRILPLIIFVFSAVVYGQSPHEKSLNYDCSNCHQTSDWQVIPQKISFDHEETNFQLTGQHISVSCRSCHTSLKFKDTKSECMNCHKDIHSGALGFDCARCHTPQSWMVKDINNLHQMSRFPLLGVHLVADCRQCHQGYSNLNFTVLGTECYDCHFNDYAATVNPNHAEAGFSTDCRECHSVNSDRWSAENFSHDFFPLTGGHKIQGCFNCHKPGIFTGLSQNCYACHRVDFESTSNPDHRQEGFSTSCIQCHNVNAFVPSTFQHNQTSFPLTGRHIDISCRSCHISGYASLPTDCYSCHKNDYEAADNPDHIAANIPTDCQQCHSTSSWEDGDFNHSTGGFPLTGAHVSVSCSSCHQNTYTGTSSECFSCHQQNYNTALNHSSQNYPQTCALCHNTTAWNQTDFNHDNTSFPLAGVHINTQCSSCHISGFTGTPGQCVSCHQQDYDIALDHASQNYPLDCSMCHSPAAWNQTNFNHDNTSFPLTGIHINTQCSSCHVSGFTGTPNQCVSCHQGDYDSSVNPDHSSLSIPVTCQDCHSVSQDWQPASFAIHNNYYILEGAHSSISSDCALCHNGNYTSIPNTCFGCHDDDYNGTTNPPHSSAGFSTECHSCHTQIAWIPSTFDHSVYFPINTGRHQGEWNSCSDCHTDPSNYSVFSCITCHDHNQNDMDNKHGGISGYVYQSSACYSCHPNGESNKFRIRRNELR